LRPKEKQGLPRANSQGKVSKRPVLLLPEGQCWMKPQ